MDEREGKRSGPSGRTLRGRPANRWPALRPIKADELEWPTWKTPLKLVYNTIARVFHDPVGLVLGSAFLLLMLWGPHANVELLGLAWPSYAGPGSDPATRAVLIPGVPWDHELISNVFGMLLLVLIPIILIKRSFGLDLKDFGLGLPYKNRWGLTCLSTLLLCVLGAVAIYFSSRNDAMRATYPLYRGSLELPGPFIVYELQYLMFFVAIEFTFRGYLLFGLFRTRDAESSPGLVGEKGPLVFGYYAILISMLSYTAWHLGKPVPELFGTLIWGLSCGAIALTCGTIWHIILVHWLMNVFMDLAILQS